jgi:hypothetical protein
MPLPLAPVAGIALRYAAVAGTAYLLTRRLERGRLSQPVEDEMDDTPEGVTTRREGGQMNARPGSTGSSASAVSGRA